MSVLQSKDTNAQSTSNLFNNEKHVAAGAENKAEEAGQQKQAFDKRFGYVYATHF